MSPRAQNPIPPDFLQHQNNICSYIIMTSKVSMIRVSSVHPAGLLSHSLSTETLFSRVAKLCIIEIVVAYLRIRSSSTLILSGPPNYTLERMAQ